MPLPQRRTRSGVGPPSDAGRPVSAGPTWPSGGAIVVTWLTSNHDRGDVLVAAG
jgi:hypothetical protein